MDIKAGRLGYACGTFFFQCEIGILHAEVDSVQASIVRSARDMMKYTYL